MRFVWLSNPDVIKSLKTLVFVVFLFFAISSTAKACSLVSLTMFFQ
ncbi:hypothetical protein [uncultured Gammaproteobacteria bacterium]|nr:hypothetical protein [uncultured Gammaproteobacteria bacterium]